MVCWYNINHIIDITIGMEYFDSVLGFNKYAHAKD